MALILAAAETALGGGVPLPDGYTYATLFDLVANLDLSFDRMDAIHPTLRGCQCLRN